MTETYDILITNATIVDGTGKPAFRGNIGVVGERIAAVGNTTATAHRTIDASGLVASPGFVDSHSHGDLNILQYPHASSFVMQGVTTFLGGNCGMCLAPVVDADHGRRLAERYRVSLDEVPWQTFGEWLSTVEDTGISVNYVPLAGHNTIRTVIMGEDFNRHATPDEVEAMKVHVREAMQSGAFGLSSGFDPGPCEHATTAETIELAKVAQSYGGIYSPHTRFHQDSWVTDNTSEHGYGLMHAPKGEVVAGRYHGLLEATEIAREADIRLLIAHFTPAYILPQPQPAFLQEAAARATLHEIVDKQRQDGVDVYFNVIAYPPSIGREVSIAGSFLNQRLALPPWIRDLSAVEFSEKLNTSRFRRAVKDFFYSGRIKFFMVHPLINPYWMDCFTIIRCSNPEYEGATVGDIAREKRGARHIVDLVYDASLETVFDILTEDPEATWSVSLDIRENPAALSVFLGHPAGIPCADTFTRPSKSEEAGVHGVPPIAYGLYPYYIRTFVIEQGLLTLEEAINKASYVPAREILGLTDRGVVARDAYADIVLFDLDNIGATGSFADPAQPPTGIEYVFVNGSVAYENARHTGAKTGKVLRR